MLVHICKSQISGASVPGTWHDIHGNVFISLRSVGREAKTCRYLDMVQITELTNNFSTYDGWWLFSDSFLVNLDSKSKFVMLLYVKQNPSLNECSPYKWGMFFCWIWPWFFRPKHLKFQNFRRKPCRTNGAMPQRIGPSARLEPWQCPHRLLGMAG